MKDQHFNELGVSASFDTFTHTGVIKSAQSQILTDVNSKIINQHIPQHMDVVTNVTHTNRVSFRIEDTTGNQDSYELDNVDISIGDKVTLVFASDAGKSMGYIVGCKNHTTDKVSYVPVDAVKFDFSSGGKKMAAFFRFVAAIIIAAVYGKGKGGYIAGGVFFWVVFEFLWFNWYYKPQMNKKYFGFFSDLVIKSLRHDAHRILQELKTFRLREGTPKEKEDVPA